MVSSFIASPGLEGICAKAMENGKWKMESISASRKAIEMEFIFDFRFSIFHSKVFIGTIITNYQILGAAFFLFIRRRPATTSNEPLLPVERLEVVKS